MAKDITTLGKTEQDSVTQVSNHKVVAAVVKRVVRKSRARKISSALNVSHQKEKKREKLDAQMKDIRATLKRGYQIVIFKGDTRHQNIDASEREYFLQKLESLKLQLKIVKAEISDSKHAVKSGSKKAKLAHRNEISKMREQEQLKKVGRKIIGKLEEVITEDTISNFPELSTLAVSGNDEQSSVEVLEKFFSINLSEEFEKFRNDSKLAKVIYSGTIKHLKEVAL